MPVRYLVVRNNERGNGGIREMGNDPSPPHWLVYFGVDDIDAGLAKAAELGGTVMAGPIDIGIARIGIVQDPQGAMFALYDGDFED
jgi:predicted enzyme related to lactoylglutathione lyase